MEDVLPRPKLRDHFEAFLCGQNTDSGESKVVWSGKSFTSHGDLGGPLSGTEVRIKTESFDCEPTSNLDFLRVPVKTEKLDDGTRSGSDQDVHEIAQRDITSKPVGIKTEHLGFDDIGVSCHPTTSSSLTSHGVGVKREKEDYIGVKTEQEEYDRCAVKHEKNFPDSETRQQILTDSRVKDEADSSHGYITDGESIHNLCSTRDDSMDLHGSAVKANGPEHTHCRSRDRKAKNLAKIILKNLEENVDLGDGKQVGMLQTSKRFFSNPMQSVPGRLQNMKNEFNKYKGMFSLQECSVKVRRLSEEVLVRYGITLDAADKKVDVHTLKKGLFSCSECSFRSHHVKELREHQWKHRTNTAYHKCMECNYRTKWVHGIASHVKRVHRKLKPYQCPHCDYRTATSTALKMHINVHTSNRPYKCPYCNYRSVAQASLRSHVYTHTGEKPYACPHCSYRSTQYAHLKSHLYVHTKEKPYACELCEYKTTQSTHLRSHMQVIHTDVKPFKCEHCSYAGKSLAGLKIHVRKHTGERPYACMVCSYKTTQSTSLRVHMRGHMESRRCKCSVCGYSTHTAFSLKTHIASCHETL